MKISTAAGSVLERVMIDGNLIKLPEQLDRKLYLEVNKVLEALGGKWSRAKKGHVFDQRPDGLLDEVLVAGEVTTAKDLGFFRTPAELAERMAIHVCDGLADPILEPSAGDGALVRACMAHGATVIALEYDPGRRAQLSAIGPIAPNHPARLVVLDEPDFLVWSLSQPPYSIGRIIANPPFGRINGTDHVNHLWAMLGLLRSDGKLACVMPSSLIWRQGKQYETIRRRIHELGGRIEQLPEGTFKASGTMVNTCLVLI